MRRHDISAKAEDLKSLTRPLLEVQAPATAFESTDLTMIEAAPGLSPLSSRGRAATMAR